ncbi:MAG: homoserine kinase [Sporolactobacillus sp.]
MSGCSPIFRIKVPGSTANLGPGFDSIGMAIDRYLVLDVSPADTWAFHYLDQPSFDPPISENLIYQSACRVAADAGRALPPCTIEVHSAIPLSRGLGSSGAAIIAGIELADRLLHLHLKASAKAWIACQIEGHPDNVTASLYGGLVISHQTGTGVHSVCFPAPAFDFVTLIPDFELRTSDARRVLPDSLPFRQAIEGSSVANVLIAALLQSDGELAGQMMESDCFHQCYRTELLPHYSLAQQLAHDAGAFGLFLSGAGPTLMALARSDNSARVQTALQEGFPAYETVILHPVSTHAVCLSTAQEN